ncbi:Isohexenylglutaconyl-CoA hydratase [Rubrivivax sp. A210]|uniref:enoyl-CoA hydratase/isomerase family protein n=1 Tax=Rubrivivax sp. A210 TaxID=2772301 RepID=UPI00191AF822|nr:enoyl-CoA hydratase-related protein [Rubrivivax sp. A210]CAD5369866.1 Isohexenylglutaconyl-CoA hydratase [Rubrivivax sp. A210]
MNPQTLIVRADGPVLHLTLNRPEVRNAMSMAMVQELSQALAAAEADGRTRIIVLAGSGGHFCAGADLKDMALARERLAEDAQALVKANAAFGEMCAAYAATGLALVAVLEGSVMGGGLGLACIADVAIAGTSAQFRLPETSLGMVPAQVAPYLVERLGYSEARRLAVTGGRLDAQQALDLRLVHAIHPAGALDAALHDLVREILQCAPGAIAATKALMTRARLQAPLALVQPAAQAYASAALGAEGLEGTTAFLQKRKAGWAPQ